MGFQVDIGGFIHELESFSVQEAATPLAAGDSSGQVGTITLTVKAPDPDLAAKDANLLRWGPQMLTNRTVRLTDTRKGFTLGKVVSVSQPYGGNIQLTCESRLGLLNVYNVQAQPFVGTLADAFEYYCSIANVTTDVFIDPDIALDPVVFPGFNGELWFNLKQMAAAVDADISLVSGVILLRPIRLREAAKNRDVDRSMNIGGQLAQSVEVFRYDNQAITDELVYPPGGWSQDVESITVNAGETIEEVIELSASVSSVQQPVMQTFVSRDYSASSVYTVVGDDGLPIDPQQWADHGGSLEVVINPETTSLTVKITAPEGLPNKDGNLIGVYGISLSADESTGRYSTLRIVGSGVSFNKTSVIIPTGVPASLTGTEIGTTIDNPFLSTLDQLYRAGTRAARQFTGRTMTLSGSVIAVNRLGDSGVATYPPYSFDQDQHDGQTYGQVQSGYSGQTYAMIQQALFDLVQNDYENQVFGNVNGARIWDQKSRRWYRIREGTLNPDTISFSADDDLTHGDIQEMWSSLPGYTYGLVNFTYQFFNATYEDENVMGMIAK